MTSSNDHTWEVSLPALNAHRPSASSGDLRSLVFPSPDSFVAGVEAFIESGEPSGHRRLWEAMGVPGDDFTVNPLSLRLGCIGASKGVSFYHHELRTDIPVHEALLPEVASGEGGWAPEWQNGVLTEPRYFSFRMDGRLQCYNPNHRRQWRPHEVMHGAVGFFWRPDMTRFEAYLGARLNELLPVIHWYGWDEVFRPVCDRHRGQRLYHTYCPECEAAAKPFWELSVEERAVLREPAIEHAAFGMEHWSSEWEACLRELESGVRHPVPRPRLDASSDALGYVLGHWNRITAWSMGAWMERFMVAGVDYFESNEALAEGVLTLHQDLLFNELRVDGDVNQRLKHRRVFQDCACRLLIALEHLEEGSAAAADAERALEPAFSAVERYVRESTDEVPGESAPVYQLLLEGVAEASHFLPGTFGDLLPGLGIQAPLKERSLKESLVNEGLHSTFTRFEEANAVCEEPLLGFVESRSFEGPGRLGQRYLNWLKEEDVTLPGNYQEELRFEMKVLTSMGRDEEGEHFGALPDHAGELATRGATLRLNTTARRLSTVPEVAGLLLGLSGDDLTEGSWDGAMHVGVASYQGSVRGMALTPALWSVWERLSAGEVLSEEEHLEVLPLIERAFAFWIPVPR